MALVKKLVISFIIILLFFLLFFYAKITNNNVNIPSGNFDSEENGRIDIKGAKRVPARGAPAFNRTLSEDYTNRKQLSHKDHMCFVSCICLFMLCFDKGLGPKKFSA